MNYPPRPDQHRAPGYGPPPVFRSGYAVGRGLTFFAPLGVTILGVVGFFLGFAPYAKYSTLTDGDLPGAVPSNTVSFFDNAGGGSGTIGLALLLAAAVTAGVGLLPGQRHNGPVVTGLSAAGFATLLFLLIGLQKGQDVGVGLILVLVAGFLQTALAATEALVTSGTARRNQAVPDFRPPPPAVDRPGFPPRYGPPGPRDGRGGPLPRR